MNFNPVLHTSPSSVKAPPLKPAQGKRIQPPVSLPERIAKVALGSFILLATIGIAGFIPGFCRFFFGKRVVAPLPPPTEKGNGKSGAPEKGAGNQPIKSAGKEVSPPLDKPISPQPTPQIPHPNQSPQSPTQSGTTSKTPSKSQTPTPSITPATRIIPPPIQESSHSVSPIKEASSAPSKVIETKIYGKTADLIRMIYGSLFFPFEKLKEKVQPKNQKLNSEQTAGKIHELARQTIEAFEKAQPGEVVKDSSIKLLFGEGVEARVLKLHGGKVAQLIYNTTPFAGGGENLIFNAYETGLGPLVLRKLTSNNKAKWEKEIEIQKAAESPQTLKLHGSFEDKEWGLGMLVEKCDTSLFLYTNEGQEAIEEPLLTEFAKKILTAVLSFHKKYAHLDLKPDNFLIKTKNIPAVPKSIGAEEEIFGKIIPLGDQGEIKTDLEEKEVLLADFGNAKPLEENPPSCPVMGTFGYQPPTQWSEPPTKKIEAWKLDAFALGKMFIELKNGKGMVFGFDCPADVVEVLYKDQQDIFLNKKTSEQVFSEWENSEEGGAKRALYDFYFKDPNREKEFGKFFEVLFKEMVKQADEALETLKQDLKSGQEKYDQIALGLLKGEMTLEKALEKIS